MIAIYDVVVHDVPVLQPALPFETPPFRIPSSIPMSWIIELGRYLNSRILLDDLVPRPVAEFVALLSLPACSRKAGKVRASSW